MSSRGSSWSFRGSSLRCRGRRQPPSSSILSSCETSSLLGYLHHRLSLLQHYSPVDFRVRDSRAFSLPLPSSRFLRLFSPRATLLFRGVHSTSSAQTSPSLEHSFHLLQRADWSVDTLAHHCCDLFRDVGFRDCGSSSVRGWDYRDSAVISCLERSSHSWCFSGSGDRDCSYCCYYIFSSCTCSTNPDCFTVTSIYRGLA
jgi:hypothetical protein